VKTAHSRRTIDLDPRTVSMLRAWRRHQLELKMSTGRRGDDEFVFTHPDGGPIHPDLFSQSWQRLMRKSEQRRIRLHDLRHTHVTILPGISTARRDGARSTTRGGAQRIRYTSDRGNTPTTLTRRSTSSIR
jgi:integrase